MNVLDLLPSVHAQSDATAQPTFGNIDVGDTTAVAASMLLSSSATQVQVGDTFTVTVEIKTNDTPINEYIAILEYDSAVLSVIDQDIASTGTQVELLDTVFSTSNPAQDNIATASGIITVDASLSSGSSLTVNRKVVEVTFQAQSAANTVISVKTGTDGSQLIRQTGSAVNFNSNEVTIDIITQSGGDTGQDQGGDTGGTTGDQGGTTGNPVITQIPDTAITDSLEGTVGLGIGVSLILLGVALILKRSPKKDK